MLSCWVTRPDVEKKPESCEAKILKTQLLNYLQDFSSHLKNTIIPQVGGSEEVTNTQQFREISCSVKGAYLILNPMSLVYNSLDLSTSAGAMFTFVSGHIVRTE